MAELIVALSRNLKVVEGIYGELKVRAEVLIDPQTSKITKITGGTISKVATGGTAAEIVNQMPGMPGSGSVATFSLDEDGKSNITTTSGGIDAMRATSTYIDSFIGQIYTELTTTEV